MAVTINPFALTSLEMAKTHLGVPLANVSFDDLITRSINAATAKIESFCDRKLKERTGIVEYQDGFANGRILLDQWPVTNLAEVWIDRTGLFTDTDYKLTSDKYALDYSARGEALGLSLRGCLFPRGTRNIKIVYDAGFATIPDDLEDACLWMVEFLYDLRNDHRIGVSQKGKNQENTTFRDDLPAIVQHTLFAYKRAEWPTGDRAVYTV